MPTELLSQLVRAPALTFEPVLQSFRVRGIRLNVFDIWVFGEFALGLCRVSGDQSDIKAGFCKLLDYRRPKYTRTPDNSDTRVRSH